MATATTMIVPRPNSVIPWIPAKNIPAIAMITVSPEISTERPEVDAAALQRRLFAAPCRTLLALTLEIEHRVVDADGEPDQQDQLVDGLIDGHQRAGNRDQPEGGEDGGQREQQRDARGDEASEDDDQDDQRHRQREHARLRQVVQKGSLNPLVGAGVAELADEVPLIRPLDVGHRVDDRIDLRRRVNRVALDIEVDERGATVRRDLGLVAGFGRRADVLDEAERRDLRNDVGHDRLERRIVRIDRLALDQHGLTRRLLEAGVEDPVGAARLAHTRRVVVDLGRADHVADHKRDDHKS